MQIPDDVWETRCRYCRFCIRENNNNQISVSDSISGRSLRIASCRIFAIAGYDRVPGECESFQPNHIYGICYTCQYSNAFHDGYCMRNEENRKQLFKVGCMARDEYWGKHIFQTCENYSLNPNWMDLMRKQAEEGKIPRNFDPETMKPATDTTDEVWQRIDKAKKAAEEIQARQEEASAAAVGETIGMDELMREMMK